MSIAARLSFLRKHEGLSQRALAEAIFEEDELVANADLALQFHAIANMPDQQQSVIKQLLEGMIIK